jgi:hypothetical protein
MHQSPQRLFLDGWQRPCFRVHLFSTLAGVCRALEIIADRLYLIGLQGTLKDGTEASLATLFPGFPTRVFAHWYSGSLRIPQGGQIEYVHMGYGSRYERDLFLEAERGVVVTTRVRNNGQAASKEAPQGYGVGAMTVFPRADRHDRGKP